MRYPRPCLYLAFVLAAGSVAIAQSPKPLAVLPGNGFMLTGDWKCEGQFGNGKPHKATFTGATILGDKWIELTERDVEPATGYLAKYLIGYDPQQARLVEFDANNFGAAVYSSDRGWQNGVLTMTSPISQDTKAAYAANRFIYTVLAGGSFSVDWQIEKTPASAWVQADHLVCNREPVPAS